MHKKKTEKAAEKNLVLFFGVKQNGWEEFKLQLQENNTTYYSHCEGTL